MWTNPTYPIYNQGYNPLTIRMNHQVVPFILWCSYLHFGPVFSIRFSIRFRWWEGWMRIMASIKCHCEMSHEIQKTCSYISLDTLRWNPKIRITSWERWYMTIPLFIGFQPSKMVQDFATIKSRTYPRWMAGHLSKIRRFTQSSLLASFVNWWTSVLIDP